MSGANSFIRYLQEKHGFKQVRKFYPGNTMDFHEFFVGEREYGEKLFIKVDRHGTGSIKREGEILQLPSLQKSCYFPDLICLGVWNEMSYVVIDFLEGIPLKEILLKKSLKSKLPVQKILKQLTEIGLILNKEGIVHRDIRPGNIITQWDKGGRFKQLVLIDFAFSVGINKFRELPVLVDKSMLKSLGTKRYKPDLGTWDNFYSIKKIAIRLDENYGKKYPNEEKLINRNVGKLVYVHK